MMKLSYSYRRFSSKKQATGTSLERQLERAIEVSTANGWHLQDLPPDAGISAYKGHNLHVGAISLFIQKVKNKEIPEGSVLIVEKMDRFSRDHVDMVMPQFLGLLHAGMEFYSCTDGQHYTLQSIRSNPMQLNYAVMAMAMANDYSKALGDRIQKTFNRKYANAQANVIVNFGPWVPAYASFVGNKSQPGKYVLNDKAETVKHIIKEYMAGKRMKRIAIELNENNIPCIQDGKFWRQGQIKCLLTSQHLLGHCKVKGIEYKSYFPALISEEEFNALQAKLETNKLRRGGSSNDYVANIFRNRIFCKHCNGHINCQYSGKPGNYTYFYKCQNARFGKCNSKKMFSIPRFEELIFSWFFFDGINEIIGQSNKDNQKEIDNLLGQKLKIEKRITKLVSMDDLDVESIRLEIGKSKLQLEKLNDDIKLLQHKHVNHSNLDMPVFQRNAKQLKDNECRKELQNMLPSAIHAVKMDLDNKCYWVDFEGNDKNYGPFPLWHETKESNDLEMLEEYNRIFKK